MKVLVLALNDLKSVIQSLNDSVILLVEYHCMLLSVSEWLCCQRRGGDVRVLLPSLLRALE